MTVTVVVPTYNEAGNVAELVRRLEQVAEQAGIGEVLFVDDSNDSTPYVIGEVARVSALPVRLIHRPAGTREGGLSGAVTEGLRRARYPWAVVMDGDLQHPPEDIPRLIAGSAGTDLVIASRYCQGGDAGGLDGGVRRFVSTGSTRAAAAMFPRRLRGRTDTMTGFFAVRREALDLRALRPQGFKILLEILVRHRLVVADVPFRFAERHAGESKASWSQGLRFARQLARLRWDLWRGTGRQFASFAAIGAASVALDAAVFNALLLVWNKPLTAKLLASSVAICASYWANARWTWPDAVRGQVHRKLPIFAALSLAGVGISMGCLWLSHYVIGWESVLMDNVSANVVGLGLGMLWRFWSYSRWVFSAPAPAVTLPVQRDAEPATRVDA